MFDIFPSSLLFEDLIVKFLGFVGDVTLLLHVSALRFMHLRSFLLGGPNSLCSFSWGFCKSYLGMGSDWVVMCFLFPRLEMCGSVVKHPASVLEMVGATPYYKQGEEA
jgi:hypothetical protein